MPDAAGKEKVFIRFRWKGNYEYAWRLDDVALFEGNPQPARDLVVSAPILPESFGVPVSQVQEVPFVATVSNKGTLAQPKVKFSVKVISSNGQSFNADTTLLNLKSGLVDTFSIPKIFIPGIQEVMLPNISFLLTLPMKFHRIIVWLPIL